MYVRARVVMTFVVCDSSDNVVAELETEAAARRLRDEIERAMNGERNGPVQKRTLRGRRAMIPALVLYVLGFVNMFTWAASSSGYALDKRACAVVSLFWPLAGAFFAVCMLIGSYRAVLMEIARIQAGRQ